MCVLVGGGGADREGERKSQAISRLSMEPDAPQNPDLSQNLELDP